MTVTIGEVFAADAGDGAMVTGSGTAGFGVDSFAGNVFSFAVDEGGDAGLSGCADRFVTFCPDGFTGSSVSTRGVATKRVAAATVRGTGAVAVTAESGATPPEGSTGSGGCCERGVSLTRGCAGMAMVAITSTATPASVTICPRLDCQGAVVRAAGTVTLSETDATAARSSMTGTVAGATVLVAAGLAR